MLYVLVLFVHSWLRWIVLASGALVLARGAHGLARSRPWTARDDRFGRLFLAALDMQILLGLALYFALSPITPKSIADLRAFMSIASLRFFAIEHVTGMIAGAAAAHIGWVRGKRATSDRTRQRRVVVGVAVALVAIVVSVPWPFLPYGRPWLRP